MGQLGELDLSQKISKKEEEEAGLETGWSRLSQLRLTLGGQIGPKRIGPPVCVLFEGWVSLTRPGT